MGSRSLQSEYEKGRSWQLLPASVQQGLLHGIAVDLCAEHRQAAQSSFGHLCKSFKSRRGPPALDSIFSFVCYSILLLPFYY